MKVCTKCRAERPLTDFNVGKGKFGKHSWCRPCCKGYARTDEQKARQRVYALRQHYKNPGASAARKSKYMSSLRGRAVSMLNAASQRAQRKDLKFDLGLDWLVDRLLSKCALTGRSFDLSKPAKSKRNNPNSPSIDRIDPHGPYTKANCRVVVIAANIARQQMLDGELLSLATDIIRTISSRAPQGEGSTTIPKGSRAKRPEAHGTLIEGDDIVSSAR